MLRHSVVGSHETARLWRSTESASYLALPCDAKEESRDTHERTLSRSVEMGQVGKLESQKGEKREAQGSKSLTNEYACR